MYYVGAETRSKVRVSEHDAVRHFVRMGWRLADLFGFEGIFT